MVPERCSRNISALVAHIPRVAVETIESRYHLCLHRRQLCSLPVEVHGLIQIIQELHINLLSRLQGKQYCKERDPRLHCLQRAYLHRLGW